MTNAFETSTHRTNIPVTIVKWLAFALLTAIVVAPVWHVVVYAFMPERAQFGWPFVWLPTQATFANFTRLFQDPATPIARWFLNSLIVTAGGTTLVLVVSSLSAYAFARLSFPGRDTLFFILLIGLMVPTAVTLIPTFLTLRDLKVLDTHVALWVPALVNVGGVFLLRQQFFGIPRELEDAARVDGAGRLRIFWQVDLPLIGAALIVQAVLSFLFFWNDLLWPLVVLSDRDRYTLTLGLLFFSFNTGMSTYFAAAVLAAIPAFAFYALFQRQIIAGVTTAGLAGR